MRQSPASPEISDPFLEPAVLRTPLSAPAILERLGRAARLGRLPGFAARGAAGFRVEADAVPFAHEIIGAIEDVGAEGSRVELTLRRMGRMPLIFAVVIALTVWPGVWLTDSLLATYWGDYGRWSAEMPWLTYAWYLPITVLPLPWMWRSLSGKSRAMAMEATAAQVAAIAAELDASRMASA